MKSTHRSLLPSFAIKFNKLIKVALPVVLTATTFVTAHAQDTKFTRYNLVADAVGNSDSILLKSYYSQFANNPRVKGGNAFPGSDTQPPINPLTVTGARVSVWTTAWQTSPQNSKLTAWLYDSSALRQQLGDFNLSQQEQDFSISFATSPFSLSQGFGLFTPNNVINGGQTDPYYRGRNFRVIYSGTADGAPLDVTYSNLIDGGNYNALPSPITGTATPISATGGGIISVYSSLRRNSDGLYWNGSQWTSFRVNFPAVYQLIDPVITSNSTGRVNWTNNNSFPSGSNLPAGQYRLSTMAINGLAGNPQPGTRRDIEFTIGGIVNPPTPTPTPPPAGDTIAPNPSTLVSPRPGSTVSSLSQLNGICSDNPGGSGVARVLVNIVYEGSAPNGQPNPITWNWDNKSWNLYSQSINSNYLIAQSNGTSWSSDYAQAVAPTGSQLYDGYYTIRLFTRDRAGNGDTYSVFSLRVNKGYNGGYYRIKNRYTNLYISDIAVPNTPEYAYATTLEASRSEWQLTNADGYTRFQNRATGKFLNIEPNDGNLRSSSAPYGWYSSHWVIRSDASQYVRIESRWQPNQSLNSEGRFNPNTGVASSAIQPFWLSAQWVLEPVASNNLTSGASASQRSASGKTSLETPAKASTSDSPSGGSS